MRSRQAILRLAAVGLLALALLAAFALELADTQAKSRDDVKARVHERGELASALIDSLFASSAQTGQATNPALYGGTTISTKVLEAKKQTSLYLMVLDGKGRELAATRGVTAAVRADVESSAPLRAVLAGKQPYGIGDTLPFGKGDAKGINFFTPFKSTSGTRILVTGFPPAALAALISEELRRIPGVEGAFSSLVDGRRTVLASTNPERPSGYVFREPGQIAALGKSTGVRKGRYYDQTTIAGSRWHLILSAPEDRLFATVSGLRKWVPWAIFIAFALVTLAAFALARRALRASEQVRDANRRTAALNAELARSNDALERRAAELARSNDELEQFASIASHDLQEPLRKVRTFTQQLTVIEAENLSEKGRDYLERTNAAAERMQRLIEDLLRFSRVATRARPFVEVDLAAITGEVLVDLEHEVERAGATVRVGPLPTVCGDESQLRQLMTNLVSNGLKFRREGVPPQVEVAARVDGDVASITVADNGIGFEPQYAERIFRVFERLHSRSAYAGTGIGLALCRKIVERHGGTIAAAGAPGQGATFTVALPVDQREEVIAPPRAERHDDEEALAHA